MMENIMHSKLLSLAVTAALLSACGGSNSTPTPTITPTSSVTPTPTITPTPTVTPTPIITPTPISNSGVAQLVKGAIGDHDSVPIVNCTATVNSLSALEDAIDDLIAGDTLCLADGTYSGDLSLSINTIGTAENPVTIAAENPGQVIIHNGEVSIRLGGEYLILQGFIFRDGGSNNAIITFRDNNECSNCRVTEVSLIDMDTNNDDIYESTKWIEIYGQYNRVDHSWFSGKTSRGALLVIPRYIDSELFDEATWPAEYAQIDHNYFGDRPPAFGKGYAVTSDNEYEAIRLGLSTTHTAISNSVVEYNYFERIQAEAEVISNKATNNIIRNNTIRDSYGSIVTRHGSGATIANNIIIGDDHPFSGGIRLVDGDHIVTNNYVQGARYLSSNWNGGIVLTSGDGSGATENGYQNVEHVLVANNTIVDSVNSLNVFGGNESQEPMEIYFVNNIIANALGPIIRTNGEDMPLLSTFASNYVYGQAFSDDDDLSDYEGMTVIDAALGIASDGLLRPSDNSPDLSADSDVDVSDFMLPIVDMDGQTRSNDTTSGADEALNTTANLGLLTADLIGPLSYTPTPGKTYVDKVILANHDFDSGDTTGWLNNGAVITTANDDVFSRGASLKLDSNTADISQTVAITADTNYTLSAFMKGTAQIAITTGIETHTLVAVNNSYSLETLSFHSSDATEAVISASVADFVDIQAIQDSDFTGFKAGDNDWSTVEGADAGDVASSSNSASGADGSAKLGYNLPSHDNTSPSIFQTVDVSANTDYVFSLAMLVKNGSTSTAALHIEGDSSVVVDNVLLDINDLTDTDLDDSFKQYTSSINSADNTELTVTITYNPHTIIGDLTVDEDGRLSSDTQKANELRIDNVTLITGGSPADGTEAFFDSFRLVTHPLSPAESIAADE